MMLHNIKRRLDLILEFMQPYWDLVNCHMVNFLTHNFWNKYVPMELQKEIPNVSYILPCFETVFCSKSPSVGRVNSHLTFPEFEKFYQNTKNYTLTSFGDVLTNLDELYETIGLNINDLDHHSHIKEFLSYKKRHEVELSAQLLHNVLSKTSNLSDAVIIDAGDGKGYLSSFLALEYDYKVLGIDCNESITMGAKKRSRKLERVWHRLKEKWKAEQMSKNDKFSECRKKKEHIKETSNCGYYKCISKYVTTDLKLLDLLEEHYSEYTSSFTNRCICLSGLHTCGNLSSTCLKIFHNQSECKLLLNIGCCYHLIKEMYLTEEHFSNSNIMDSLSEFGFPLSQYLQSKHIKLGRNAKMLATQSMERALSAKKMSNSSLFYRALLQLLLCMNAEKFKLEENIQIGKIQHFNNFAEYISKCLHKFPSLPVDKTNLHTIEEEYKNERQFLELFYFLRMSFAPIIESIILLDRLLFLHEMGHTHSYLIPLFDPVISPRHYAIVAIKK